MLKEALQIYNRLLETGQIDSRGDSELYLNYKKDEVRSLLSQFEEELGFQLLDTGNTLYLIPCMDNDVLGCVLKDLRLGIASDARLVDVYLQCYLCMMIFRMFYGGKNANPIQREFIQTKDLIEELDNAMENYVKQEGDSLRMEETYGINFLQIAQNWRNKQIGDGGSRKSKVGTVQRAYGMLEKEKLIRILEEGRQIRRTKRMDDLFLYYYLGEERVQEIHRVFEKPVGKVGENAGN